MPTNRITKFTFNGNLDFSSKIMSLDTAKWILSHLSAVNGKTIQFSTELWSLIEDDEEAIELLEEAYNRGWNSNEPDIIIIADNGYNGVVRVNNADMQLTETSTGSGIWIKQSAGSITAMDYFLMHDNRNNYNSTSSNIKSVRFGKNINTSSCTTMTASFCCYGTSASILEKIDVKNINTSNVTAMNACFANIYSDLFKINGIDNWDVSKVANFSYFLSSSTVNQDFDLHKWHVKSSANLNYIFSSLAAFANRGRNPKFYYTPGYWATDPMTTIGANLVKPIVYPYYDITVAANSSYTGNVRFNGGNKTLTKNSIIGVWYYTFSENESLYDMEAIIRNETNVLSVSFKDTIPISENGVSTYQTIYGCSNLRTFEFPKNLILSSNCNELLYQGPNTSTSNTNLCCVYGPEKLISLSSSVTGGRALCCGQAEISYFAIDLSEITCNNYYHNLFKLCSNLIRIKGIPGVANGVDTTNSFNGCTALTTIENSGPISETLSFSDSPLNLASAKVILSALQQVTSETISFSTTTWGYILADDEAIELLETAYSNGWNSNEPDIQVVAQSGYDGVVRLNGANKQLTNISGTEVWYGSAGTVTAMDDFLKHRNSTYYNSTSTNIKSVRFGKNINTASCTTLFAAFDCGSSTNTLFTKMDVRHLNTSSVTNFQATFADMASSVKSIIGLEDWNVSSGTNFRYMFNAVYLGDATIDLHKWHISSSADIFSMLGALNAQQLYGENPKFYYTPGYWGKDPMNDNNMASNIIKPTVYPYHDITIAGSTSFSGNILLNKEGASTAYTATMTRDNTLGIWYYDIPSNVSISSLNRMLYRSNDATVRDNVYSLSFAESIRSKLDYEPQVASYFGLFGMVQQCMAIRTVDIDALRGIKAGGANQMFYSNLSGYTSKLCCIYGLEGIIAYYTGVEGNLSGGNYHFLSCSSLRYLKLGEWDMTNYLKQCFYGCSNLIRINRFPGVLSGCNTTNAIGSCTALTTIDSSGPISETLSFSDCPLNVASAKVILSALQTVSGKTLTFSSTTKTAINGDSEALSLVTVARNKGWTIPLN